MESRPIQAFIHDLNDLRVLKETSFFDLYDYHFADFSRDLKTEIINNLSSLSEKQFNVYIKYLESQIKDTFVYDPDVGIIDKWINEFKLNEADFPFFENDKIIKLISTPSNLFCLNQEHKKTVYLIQKDFYCYTVFLEAKKMISFIEPFIDKNSSPGNKFSYIFNSEGGFGFFNNLLQYLNINDVTTHGNKAKLAAIWEAKASNELIFKSSTSKKEYLDYLNLKFNAKFKSKSFSIGSYHIPVVEKWISELKK